METERPMFSVIIPSFNRAPMLKTAVGSALGQTFKDMEVIVIDDGSTDGTAALLNAYEDDRFSFISTGNRGVSSSRNLGLKISKGAYIAFLDSDDRWTENKLELAARYIELFPDISIFHTEEIWHKNGFVLKQLKKHKKPSGHVYRDALPLCCIGMSTVVIKRSVFDDIGVFDETFEACEDYDLWLRASFKYEVKLIPEYLTVKDGGRNDQLSSKIWGLDRFRIKALEKILLSGVLSAEDRSATILELRKKCGIFAKGAVKHGRPEEAEYYAALPDKYK
ncbi:MAG: glycosyltransferase [Candidatus Omnitrophota bacterium]